MGLSGLVSRRKIDSLGMSTGSTLCLGRWVGRRGEDEIDSVPSLWRETPTRYGFRAGEAEEGLKSSGDSSRLVFAWIGIDRGELAWKASMKSSGHFPFPSRTRAWSG